MHKIITRYPLTVFVVLYVIVITIMPYIFAFILTATIMVLMYLTVCYFDNKK